MVLVSIFIICLIKERTDKHSRFISYPHDDVLDVIVERVNALRQSGQILGEYHAVDAVEHVPVSSKQIDELLGGDRVGELALPSDEATHVENADSDFIIVLSWLLDINDHFANVLAM